MKPLREVSRWIRTGHVYLHRSGASRQEAAAPHDPDGGPRWKRSPRGSAAVCGAFLLLCFHGCVRFSVFLKVCVLKRPVGAEGSRAPAIRTTGVAHVVTGGMHGHTFKIREL